jgi:hypothetical protein
MSEVQLTGHTELTIHKPTKTGGIPMKQKKESGLRLDKTTLQQLDQMELIHIKGGDDEPKLTTITPVYCKP